MMFNRGEQIQRVRDDLDKPAQDADSLDGVDISVALLVRRYGLPIHVAAPLLKTLTDEGKLNRTMRNGVRTYTKVRGGRG